MKKALKWLGIAILAVIAVIAVLYIVFVKSIENACTPGVVSINILFSNYPALSGQICNVPTEGEYSLSLWPIDKESGSKILRKSDLPAGTQYFEISFDGDFEWAAPDTGGYKARLYDHAADAYIAESEEFYIENTDKVFIINFTATPESPEKGQSVTLTWEVENANKCTLSKSIGGSESLAQVAEYIGSGTYTEVIAESSYFQLLCLGKGGRVESGSIKGKFAREFKWVSVKK